MTDMVTEPDRVEELERENAELRERVADLSALVRTARRVLGQAERPSTISS